MDMFSDIQQARDTLGDVTPLREDCGRLCGAACCAGDEDGGMLLFPGEDCLLPDASCTTLDLPGYGEATLVRCSGHCDRNSRPLACRLFPLAPVPTAHGWEVVLDWRGRGVCPLTHKPLGALRQDFVQKAREAYRLIGQTPQGNAFLQALHQSVQAHRWVL